MVPRALILIDPEAELPRAVTAAEAGVEMVESGAYEAVRAEAMSLDESASLELRINAGLSYLLEGETHVADVVFSKLAAWCERRWDVDKLNGGAVVASEARVDVVGPCASIHKNWCWALEASGNAAGAILAERARRWAAARVSAALGGRDDDVQSLGVFALSVYDVGLEGRVCRHPSFAPKAYCEDDVEARNDGFGATSARFLAGDPKALYLDLLRRSLTNYVHSDFEDEWRGMLVSAGVPNTADAACGVGSAASPFKTACEQPFDVAWRASGVGGLAAGAEGEELERARRRYQTTLSAADLLHLELLVEALDDVDGDLLEAGVFRGGACIFLRGLLATEPTPSNRKVFVADSFAGIPPPRRPLTILPDGDDDGTAVGTDDGTAVGTSSDFGEPTADWEDRFAFGQDAVRYNFRRYGMHDDGDRLVFVPGFFNVSLPRLVDALNQRREPNKAPRFALLRIDADAYDGVLDALDAIYPYLSPGGAVVIDDYHLGGARAAVHFFRRRFNVTAPLLPVPSDYVSTCTPSVAGLARCRRPVHDPGLETTKPHLRPAPGDDPGVARLYLHNKHFITGIGQHAAYWRKAPHEPVAN